MGARSLFTTDPAAWDAAFMNTDLRRNREMQLVYMTESSRGKVELRQLYGAALGLAEGVHPPFTPYPEMVRAILEKEFPRDPRS